VFVSHSVHPEDDILQIERELECELPDSYRMFMATIGASSLFSWSPHGGGPRFYDPDEVIQASRGAVSKNLDDRFCFVGEHRLMGDLMGFLVTRQGPRNFDIFCHEYPPEDYAAVSDELDSWRGFDEWLVHAVETCGEETI
jgi:hypothetical protein